jgi:hypothetical protein
MARKRIRTATGQPNIPCKAPDATTGQPEAQPAHPTWQSGQIRGQEVPTVVSSPCIIPVMLGNRTSEQWVAQYSTSHQHPVNRICHTLGIPTILVSLALFLATIFLHRLWPYATGLFVLGWLLQFIGHAFEGKEPEFFHDWRFLFVGVRWWWAKINGKG